MNSPEPKRRDETLDGGPGSSFARHLRIWFFYRGNTWSGTASELLSELKAGAAPGMLKFGSWPETPDDVCEYLTHRNEELRSAGLNVRVEMQAGLRMIGIAWVDGIRREPPVALESNSTTKLPDIATREVETEKVIESCESPAEKVAGSGEDDAVTPPFLPSFDRCEQLRNVPTRFRIDEDGQRRRRLARMALATILVVLVIAIVLWARHQLREAYVRMPAVYAELRSVKTITHFLPSKKLARKEESDGQISTLGPIGS
jgi:hypothetical protein